MPTLSPGERGRDLALRRILRDSRRPVEQELGRRQIGGCNSFGKGVFQETIQASADNEGAFLAH